MAKDNLNEKRLLNGRSEGGGKKGWGAEDGGGKSLN